jgi:hypothetical protein
VAAKFRAGNDTPRACLERCIQRIEALDGAVMAFAFLNRRTYRTGRPFWRAFARQVMPLLTESRLNSGQESRRLSKMATI